MSGIYHKGKEWANVTTPNPEGTASTDLTKVGIDGTNYNIKDANAAPNTPTFSEASTRANLSGSGESMATILGKIKKFFADLKTVAFTGGYNDLTGKPNLAAHATVPLDDETVKIGTYDGDSAVFSTCTKATYNDGVLTLASKVNFNETRAQNVFIPQVDIAEKSDTDPYIYRPSVANGDRVSEDIVGASVGWNQLVQNGNFASTSGWNRNGNTTTFSVANNEATIVSTSTNHGIFNSVQITNGHKYLLSFDIKSTQGTRVGVDIVALGDVSAKSSYFHYVRRYNASSTTSAHTVFYTQGGSENTINVKNVCLFDLTQMFGSEIADYIYNLGADNGEKFLKKYFPNSYYPYNAGELLSVEVEGKKYVGKNLVDFSQFASLYPSYCSFADEVLSILSANSVLFNTGIPVSVPQGALYLSCKLKSGTATNIRIRAGYDDGTSADITSSITPSTWTEAKGAIDTTKKLTSVRFNWSTGGTFEVKDFQLELGNNATTYEPYKEYTYTFPSQTLRGLFTLVDGELKASGDVYGDDGTLERNFIDDTNLGSLTWEYKTDSGHEHFLGTITGVKSTASEVIVVCAKYTPMTGANVYNHVIDKSIGVSSAGKIIVYDSAYNNATTFKNAVNGIYITAKKATPTTEQAEPLVMPQICDKNGTEEFITDGIVPVGHESTYYNYPDYMEEWEYKDFRDRVDYAPEKAKWHQVGIYANGDTITIDGYYNEIMLVPNHYSGTTFLACASPAIFPFELFKSITLQNSTESERIDITPAGVVGVTGTYFSNVTIYVR